MPTQRRVPIKKAHRLSRQVRRNYCPISEQNELNLVDNESTWVVDSSVLFHLTANRKCFSSYKAGDGGLLKMGNEGACRIVSIGDVCLVTSIGCRLVLKDV